MVDDDSKRRRGEPDRSDQRDRGIERRLADPDQGRLRGELHFGGTHVGPAPQQFGRHVDDDVEPGLGNVLAADRHFRDRPRRPAQQYAQCVLHLAQGARQFGNGGNSAEVLRLRLLDVQFGLVAAREQPFGDLEAALLQGRVFVRDAQPLFERSDGCVEAGGLRRDQHLDVVVLRDAGEVTCVGGLDPAAVLAPEVHLPGDVECRAVAPERVVGPVRLALSSPECVTAQFLQLGIQAAPGDAELRAGFHDARAGHSHVRVRALCFSHDLVEARVLEDMPPLVTTRDRSRLRLGPGGLGQRHLPALEPRHGRSLKIRPHRRAGTGQQRGAAARPGGPSAGWSPECPTSISRPAAIHSPPGHGAPTP